MAKKKVRAKAAKPSRAKKTFRAPSRSVLDKLAKGRSRVKQLPLGGMEDARIPQLEAIGISYAEIRDQRIALNEEESSLKQTALQLMHQYGKTIYLSGNVEIVVTAGDESLKVKLKKPKAVNETDDGTLDEAAADASDTGDPE